MVKPLLAYIFVYFSPCMFLIPPFLGAIELPSPLGNGPQWGLFHRNETNWSYCRWYIRLINNFPPFGWEAPSYGRVLLIKSRAYTFRSTRHVFGIFKRVLEQIDDCFAAISIL